MTRKVDSHWLNSFKKALRKIFMHVTLKLLPDFVIVCCFIFIICLKYKFIFATTEWLHTGTYRSTLFECQCIYHESTNLGLNKVTTENNLLVQLSHHAKVLPFEEQLNYLHFSVILIPLVLVRPWESNSRPSDLASLQSSALLTSWANIPYLFE